MQGRKPSRAERIFRMVLRTLPFDFRADYGSEMEEVFREQHNDARNRGGIMALLRLWWETITGIFTTAPRQHWDMLKQDGAYALRMMRKNPGFTFTCVATLALGIGANTAIFSVINGVLLRPLPYRHGEKLIRVQQKAFPSAEQDISFSVKEVEDYRQRTQTLAGVAEYHNMQFTLLGHGEPRRVATGVVSSNFFGVMGVQPLLGRDFVPDDEQPGAPAVLLLSFKFWREKFGGDPGIVGQTFQMNDRPHTVIGVLPPLPDYPDTNDVWMPTSACPFRSRQKFIENRDSRMMNVYARVKPGVPLAQVKADLSVVAHSLEKEYPKSYPQGYGYRADSVPVLEEMTGQARPTFLILLGAAGLVLLLACANVANLSLSRQMRRAPEMALRVTLGANRPRILRQLLTESLLLATAGGGLGLFLAYAGSALLVSFAQRFTPRTGDIRIDTSVLLFTLGASVFCGLAFGLIPASSSWENLGTALHEGTERSTGGAARQRARGALLVVQVGLSFVLLIGAGLLLRSFYKLAHVDPGFNADRVLTMNISLNWTKYNDAEKRLAFHRTLIERVRALPGVETGTVSMTFPLNSEMGAMNGGFQIEGRPIPAGTPEPQADYRVVSPDYFRTLGMPLLRGREFTEADHEKAPQVVIINEAMARHHWGSSDPIGTRVSGDGGKTWATVVGIVGNVRQYGLDQAPADEMYVVLAQNSLNDATLLVRTSTDPMSLARSVIAVVQQIDPQQPVTRVQTLEEVKSNSLASPRLTTVLVGLFAGLALLITLAGISGVMALWVSQRTHEIGVRMALGATPGSVQTMLLREGMLLVGVGLFIGIAGALAATQLLSKILFDVRPSDPLTFLGVSLVLAVAAALACLVPARRAATIDPLVALRTE